MNAQITISVLTILFSGLVTAVVNHRLATSRQEREFKRKKLEELYLDLHAFCMLFGTFSLPWPKVMSGELEFNEALDLQIKNAPAERTQHYEKAMMLVNVYFPSLRSDLNELMARREKANLILRDFQNAFRKTGPHPDYRKFMKPYNDAMVKFNAAHEALNHLIYQLAEDIR